MEGNLGTVNSAQNKEAAKRVLQKLDGVKAAENSKVFAASLKEATKMAQQIMSSEKKQRDELRKRKDRKNQKEDFEWDDEIDQILAEIDKRMEELKAIGETLLGED